MLLSLLLALLLTSLLLLAIWGFKKMAVNLSPVGGVAGQFFDNNGNPLVGGKLFTYAAGTTTPQVTFTSALGNVPNSNPIILNGGGRVPAEIWLTDGLEYKFVLYSSTDQLIGSWDNITGINSNFVNFVTSEEVQTATAGQTVFTLTTMSYQPGTNNLVVYVDGVNQIEGSIYSFVETSSTVVTFTTGLHVGALVKFVSAETLTGGATSANLVSYTPAGTGAVATNVQTKLRETVSVKDFGAVGDGVTDDTAAIQAAVASGKDVCFSYSEAGASYLLTSTVNVTTPGQKLFSYGIPTEAGNAKIVFTNNGIGFNVTAPQVVFSNLCMEGARSGADIGIYAARTVNTDDIDVSVENCRFDSWSLVIRVIGRALTCLSNVFATSNKCIELSWPTSGVIATSRWQDLPWGFRATRITNNRAHSVDRFITVSGANNNAFRGALITDNQLDIGRGFFDGGIQNSIISNNVVNHSNTTIISITAGGAGLTISDNTFQGTLNVIEDSPANAILFSTGAPVIGTTITGNVISFIDIHGIRFSDGADRCTISNNIISAIGQDSGGGSCIFIDGVSVRNSIIGNVFNPSNTTNCIRFNVGTVQDTSVIGNSNLVGDTLVSGTFTDGGRNILSGNGKINAGSMKLTNRLLELDNNDVVKITLSRLDSTSGNGIEYKNQLGAFGVNGTPSGVAAGAYTPSSDNSISFGSASFRWSEVYAATGTINTSDENEKQDIANLTEKQLRVAKRLKQLIKTFKFRDAVLVKGDEARLHFGVIAQDVEFAFLSEGLDPARFGVFCKDEWYEVDGNLIEPDENGKYPDDAVKRTRLGVRYEELLALIIAGL
jgi:hypothetical protein